MDFNPEILVKFLLTVYLWNKFFFYIITCGISYDHLYFNSILVAICGYAVTNDHRVLQFFFEQCYSWQCYSVRIANGTKLTNSDVVLFHSP